MIDLHSHVLPGFDDGSKSLEESLTMLEAAAADGTTDIVATPHADTRYHYDPPRVEESVAELNRLMEDRIRVHSGCDFHLTHDNVLDAIEHPARYTVAHRSYLMVELSNQIIFPNTSELFERLEERGIRIVVTHPERNPLVQKRLALVERWVADGCYMQLTAQSLTGRWGERAEKFCRTLLDRGLAHFVASDAHDILQRPPLLSAAYAWLTGNYGEAMARRLLVENPALALAGEPLPPPDPARAGGRRTWFGRIFPPRPA